MKRFEQSRSDLQRQLASAAAGIAGEPDWPSGTVTSASVLAQANALAASLHSIREAELALRMLRSQATIEAAAGRETLRQVDLITTSLYGPGGSQKITYGLRPIDTNRSSPAVPKVTRLTLSDAGPGTIRAKWKRLGNAAYDIQWFADMAMTQPLGGLGSTRAQLLIPGLEPGMQVWVRVRGHRGKRMGEWSAPATRIANV